MKLKQRQDVLSVWKAQQLSWCMFFFVMFLIHVDRDPNGKEKDVKFTYDYSYWSFDKENGNFADNQTLWNDMGEGMLTSCFQGYNTSMFA